MKRVDLIRHLERSGCEVLSRRRQSHRVCQSVEKAGLKLESRKAPVETIFVDHLEKMPTEN